MFFCCCVASCLLVRIIFSVQKWKERKRQHYFELSTASPIILRKAGNIWFVSSKKLSSRNMWLKSCWLLTVVFSSNKKVFSKVEKVKRCKNILARSFLVLVLLEYRHFYAWGVARISNVHILDCAWAKQLRTTFLVP